jgi:hypothetical protein
MKKPFLHALGAALYIALIVSIMQSTQSITSMLPQKSIFIPMTMLGLLVLSVAIMGFLFFSEPIYLYIENRKKEAINFFAKTVGFFSCFVILFVILLFLFR